MRHHVTRGLLAGALLLACAAAVAGQTRTERLVVGEQRTFKPGYAVGDIAIANPAVCDFRVVSGRREVMLIASGEGFTSLTVWDQRNVKRDEVAIEVVSREFAKLMADLTELLQPYPAVSIKRLGSRVVLAGTVRSADELEAVRTIAAAAGNVVSTVTVRAGGTADEPAAATGGATSRTGGDTPRAVYDPPPPPPSKRPVGAAPEPVPLRGGAQPTARPAPAATPSPVAVPAAAAPPPPNVASGGARPGTPAAAAAAAAGDLPVAAGAGPIEYLVEIYESPSSAPPPEVAGPQGQRLFMGRIRASAGRETRHYVPVGPATAKPPRAISIGLTPAVSGNAIQTLAVIDTNLPLGPYDQKKNPVWLRSLVDFTVRTGQTRFLTEREMASTAAPTGAPPSVSTGPSTGAKVAGTAAGVGAGMAGVYVPSFGGIFGGGGGQPKARPTTLLIVLTPAIVGPVPR